MSFQSTVNSTLGFGIPGELFDDGPHRAQSYILQSASAAYNIFGTAFTIVSQGIAQAGNPTTTGVFAGILANPKEHALLGTTAGGPLAPTLTLPNNTTASLVTEGSLVVALPAAANIGDKVIYNNTTGVLSTVAPSTAIPTGSSPAHAFVDRYTIGAAGLAVITLLNAPLIS